MRAFMLVLAVLAASLAVFGCGGDDHSNETDLTTEIPTVTASPASNTPYNNSQLRVSATLPGDWRAPQVLTPTFPSELVVSNNRLSVFVVGVYDDYVPTTSEELSSFVDGFVDGFGFAPPVATTETDFHGYQAVQLEGTWTTDALDDDHHVIFYIFVAKRSVYIIGSGSSVPEWNRGGKEKATAALAGVSVN